MPLKFVCPQCQHVTIIRYLKVGETTLCRGCGGHFTIPEDTSTISEDDASQFNSDAAGPVQRQNFPSLSKYILPQSPSITALRVLAGVLIAIVGIFGFLTLIGLIFILFSPSQGSDRPTLASIFLEVAMLTLGIGCSIYLLLFASMAEHLLDIRKRILNYKKPE